MPLDVDALKIRLGIPPSDTTQDAVIAAVAADAQALCEDYCDRQFDYLADAETFFGTPATLLVHRWPIDAAVPPIVSDGQGVDISTRWQCDAARGMLYAPNLGWQGWAYRGWDGTWYNCPWLGPLTVAYTGGWPTWPRTLTWAATIAFDVLWAETPGGMLPPGAPGQSGNIKKYSVVGAYSVETAAGGVGEIGANVGTGWGALPGAVTSALDNYRRESRIGAG